MQIMYWVPQPLLFYIDHYIELGTILLMAIPSLGSQLIIIQTVTIKAVSIEARAHVYRLLAWDNGSAEEAERNCDLTLERIYLLSLAVKPPMDIIILKRNVVF
ncbi:hypothetical protein J6590_085934 [Homalodisca vitripennis]|nr:hypothetical protein J6590_085934 [Homalodisca vitripennis]